MMNSKLKSWIIAIIVIIILLIPIFVDYFNANKISTIKKYDSFSELVNKGGFIVSYVGDSSETYESKKEIMLNLKKQYNTDSTPAEFDFIAFDKLSDEDIEKFQKDNSNFKKDTWIITNEKSTVYLSNDELSETELSKLVNKYLNHVVEEDEIAYKTVSTYAEYMKVIKSKNTIMTVFGRNSCYYCNKFKPVYNDIAKEKNIDIYYIDSDSFAKDEYEKIMNSELVIPAKCTDSKEKDLPLSSGFGTPLTIFTKKGKSVDCISGYINSASLESKLKSVGMID